jgi:hypothetical protein
MASISAGVGPRLGCGEVTIYMKRIGKLLRLEREAADLGSQNGLAIGDDERA